MKKTILGVKIDDVTLDEAIQKVEGWLSKTGKYYIVTPNPEFLVAAQTDPRFKEILNQADLSIPDGVGLKLGGVRNRVTGVDLMERLIEEAGKKKLTVGFIGGKDGIAHKAAQYFREKYESRIVYTDNGGVVNKEGEWVEGNRKAILKMDLLFVGFGALKQEKWIKVNLNKIPVKIAIGVGGALDYFAGEIPRAPKVLRDLGLEWLFRLIIQPWRIKRQLALLKFIWLVLKYKDR